MEGPRGRVRRVRVGGGGRLERGLKIEFLIIEGVQFSFSFLLIACLNLKRNRISTQT